MRSLVLAALVSVAACSSSGPPPPDEPPRDAAPTVTAPTRFAPTSGGGIAGSPAYRLRVAFGTPQPYGTAVGDRSNAQLGPRFGR